MRIARIIPLCGCAINARCDFAVIVAMYVISDDESAKWF